MSQLDHHSMADASVDLAPVFLPECVEIFASKVNKASVITRLIGSLAKAGRVPWNDVVKVGDALMEREGVGTTAMGKGLAFPHMRTRAIDEFAGAIGIAPSGVDFKSLDGQPTRLIILVLSPFERRAEHAAVMGRLATLLNDKTLQYSMQVRRSPEALIQFLGLW